MRPSACLGRMQLSRSTLLALIILCNFKTQIQGFLPTKPALLFRSKSTLESTQMPLRARRTEISAYCHHHHHSSLLIQLGTSLPSVWFKSLGVPSTCPIQQGIFLASNAAYLIAAIQTIRHRSSPKNRAALSLTLVSVISFSFHFQQCILGTRQAVSAKNKRLMRK